MLGDLFTAWLSIGGTTGAGLTALVVCLGAFSLADLGWRQIPLWLTGPAFLGVLLGAWAGLWGVSWAGMVFGYGVMALAGMPGGDRKAWAVSGLLLGLHGTVWASLGFFLILGALLRGFGFRMVGVPAFPILTLVVMGLFLWYAAG